MADNEPSTAEASRPFWVKCPSCNHCWAPAHLPMEVGKWSKLLEKSACPRGCDAGPVIARQDNGVLQEEAAHG